MSRWGKCYGRIFNIFPETLLDLKSIDLTVALSQGWQQVLAAAFFGGPKPSL